MKRCVRMLMMLGLALVLTTTVHTPVKAQCAMCTATVESDNQNGGTMGKGLNAGILFLLAAPYLAAAAGGYIWYKKYRRKNINIDIPGEKLNLN